MIKRLGLVLECDTGGPDELVFRCLARRLSTEGNEPEVYPVCLGSKLLEEEAISRAEALVEIDKCDLVLIVWDQKPLWTQIKARNCIDEANHMRGFLANVKAPVRKHIRLLCLTWELETWLIAEDRAVREYLSKPEHSCDFTAPKKLDKVDDPKSHLNKAFTTFRGRSRRYEDRIEAIQIVQKWPDLNRVLKVPSFRRFTKLLTNSDSPTFHQCGTVCNDLAHQAARMGK
jgi:hypothetical protein